MDQDVDAAEPRERFTCRDEGPLPPEFFGQDRKLARGHEAPLFYDAVLYQYTSL